jgi:hypothetical protein
MMDVLLLDDWGMMKLNAENRRDLLDMLEVSSRQAFHDRDQSTAH